MSLSEKLVFTVALKVAGATIAEVEGVAEIHFDQPGEPEIWTIDLDGYKDGQIITVRMASDDPLYQHMKALIWTQCEAELYDMAAKVARGRQSYAREVASEV